MNIKIEIEGLEEISMKIRVISAVILLAIFIPLLLTGGLPYSVLMLAIALLGLHELLKIRKTKKDFPFLVELCAYVLVSFLTFNNYKSQNLSVLMDYRLMSVMMFVFLSPMVFINNSKKYNLNDALFLTSATLFVGLSFNLLILLRNFSLTYVIYLFIISCISDTFAYITGRYIGRNKLAPLISPKKTIEGLIGGTVMGVIAGVIYYTTVINPGIEIGIIIFVTLALSLIGQLGDLIFSSIKRYYDVKDFSNLIPGHGGILDRLDSIIFIVLGFILFLAVL